MRILKSILTFFRCFYATVLVYLVGFPFMVVMLTIGIIFSLFRAKTVVKALTVFWANMMFWVYFKRIHIRGQENIEPNKSYLMLGNHSSAFDIPALMAVFPQVSWIGKESLAKIPLFGNMIAMMGFTPINTKNPMQARKSIDEAVLKAKNNLCIAMFPEGTRTQDGNLHDLKRGFIYILRNSQMDVMPFTMNGLYKLKKKKQWYLNPSQKIEVIFHKPIKNEDLINLTDKEIIEKVSAVIASDIYVQQD